MELSYAVAQGQGLGPGVVMSQGSHRSLSICLVSPTCSSRTVPGRKMREIVGGRGLGEGEEEWGQGGESTAGKRARSLLMPRQPHLGLPASLAGDGLVSKAAGQARRLG